MTPLHRYTADRGHGAVLFASDLHLSARHPQGLDELRRLLALSREADALYLLGDIFEHWVGDDDLDVPFNAAAARLIATAACPVYAMHGNRDFLIGPRFEREANCALLNDPTLIDLFGTPTLLLHGDTLCTDDTRYQRFREVVRRPWVQRLFLALPHWLRTGIAGYTRKRSRQAQSAVPASLLDVSPIAVEETLRTSGVRRLLHGHTHRPGQHQVLVDGRECERWVLADWYGVGSALRVSAQGADTVSLRPT